MAAGRQPSLRCVKRKPETPNKFARILGWLRLPRPGHRKTARPTIGPASSSTTMETAGVSRRPVFRVIPANRLLPIATPANRRAMCKITRTGLPLPATRDGRPKAINLEIRPQTMVETDRTTTVLLTRGRTQTLCHLLTPRSSRSVRSR
jgi:hypothetical protein